MSKNYSAKEIKEAINSADTVNYAVLRDSLNEQIEDPKEAAFLFSLVDTALKNYRTAVEALLDL